MKKILVFCFLLISMSSYAQVRTMQSFPSVGTISPSGILPLTQDSTGDSTGTKYKTYKVTMRAIKSYVGSSFSAATIYTADGHISQTRTVQIDTSGSLNMGFRSLRFILNPALNVGGMMFPVVGIVDTNGISVGSPAVALGVFDLSSQGGDNRAINIARGNNGIYVDSSGVNVGIGNSGYGFQSNGFYVSNWLLTSARGDHGYVLTYDTTCNCTHWVAPSGGGAVDLQSVLNTGNTVTGQGIIFTDTNGNEAGKLFPKTGSDGSTSLNLNLISIDSIGNETSSVDVSPTGITYSDSVLHKIIIDFPQPIPASAHQYIPIGNGTYALSVNGVGAGPDGNVTLPAANTYTQYVEQFTAGAGQTEFLLSHTPIGAVTMFVDGKLVDITTYFPDSPSTISYGGALLTAGQRVNFQYIY